jgi:ATP-dependent Lon protease
MRYLVPKQIKANGLRVDELEIDAAAIQDIVRYYTRESGVRSLEREIAKICRKVVKEIALAGPAGLPKPKVAKGRKAKKTALVVVDGSNVDKYLGVRRFDFGRAEEENEIGLVTGLAWTEVGGDLLQIESTLVPGKGQLILTGQLGIDVGFLQKQDVHVHVPDGATPKDGPSAGAAMVTSLVSILTKVPVRADVAMTGEITLRGRVTAIGGLKEKLLAALRGGIRTVIIPEENRKDLADIPANVTRDIEIIPVKYIEQVLDLALERPLAPKKARKTAQRVTVRTKAKAPSTTRVKH